MVIDLEQARKNRQAKEDDKKREKSRERVLAAAKKIKW